MAPDGNENQQEKIQRIRNGKQEGWYNKIYKYTLSFFSPGFFKRHTIIRSNNYKNILCGPTYIELVCIK